MIKRDRLYYFLSANMMECIFTMWKLSNKKDSVDCGLFVIAFLSCMAYGNHPGKIVFEPELTTTQILKCLKNNYLTKFPGTTKNN